MLKITEDGYRIQGRGTDLFGIRLWPTYRVWLESVLRKDMIQDEEEKSMKDLLERMESLNYHCMARFAEITSRLTSEQKHEIIDDIESEISFMDKERYG